MSTTVFRSRILKAADLGMEVGTYVYLFALFNPHTTAPRELGLWVPLGIWLVKHVLTGGRGLGYLRHPVAVMAMILGGLVLLSNWQSPDLVKSLNSMRKEFGKLLFLMVVIADVFRDANRRKRLVVVAALAGLSMNVLHVVDYGRSYRATGRFLQDYMPFRMYGDPLIVFVPFTLAMAQRTRKGWSVFWWGIVTFQFLLLAAVGVRGAWLGCALGVLVWLILGGSKKVIVSGAVAAGVSLLAIVALLPRSAAKEGIQRGISSNNRLTGTWVPTFEMILDRPLTGYGYGRWIWRDEFNRRAPVSPHWGLKVPMGAHNTYLEVAFIAGVLAMGVLILLYATTFARLWKSIRAVPRPMRDPLGMAVLCAFAGKQIVEGFVESTRWEALGILLGIAVALLTAERPNSFGAATPECRENESTSCRETGAGSTPR